jgi:hypothetical protein
LIISKKNPSVIIVHKDERIRHKLLHAFAFAATGGTSGLVTAAEAANHAAYNRRTRKLQEQAGKDGTLAPARRDFREEVCGEVSRSGHQVVNSNARVYRSAGRYQRGDCAYRVGHNGHADVLHEHERGRVGQ